MPQVGPLFRTFRVMVGLGVFFILLTGTFFYLSARRRLDAHHWLLWLAVFAIPLPWVASECGWFVAEFGRQPWIIEGVLLIAAAVSDLGITQVLLTILGFVVIYTALAIIEMGLMLRAIRKGPAFDRAQSRPSPSVPHPGAGSPQPLPAE